MVEMVGVDSGGGRSLLLGFFGDTPFFRVVDFLLEHRLEDFTKTELARGAGISWASLFNHWAALEKYKIVKLTRTVGRAKLYQLNESEPLVKGIMGIELQLMKQAASEHGERMVATVKPRVAHRA